MTARFYLSVAFDQPTVTLAGTEAHHLLNVLRLKVGGQVELFDGNGRAATAEIVGITKKSAELTIGESHLSQPVAKATVTLATAVPKGDRFRWLVEKATELGVHRLIPLETNRSVVDPGGGKLKKMQQTVVAACKQCGRNRLMEIAEPATWDTLAATEFRDHRVFVADPSGQPAGEVLDSATGDRSCLVCIGPEGGFTESEIDDATTAGARLVNLGPHMLRIETAAIALVTLLALRRE